MKRRTLGIILSSITATTAVVIFCIFYFNPPRTAEALCPGEVCFGGLNAVTLICTCEYTGEEMLWVLDYSTFNLLKLTYQPGRSFLYQYYNTFATWLIGSYQPSGETCEIGLNLVVYKFCADISTDGILGYSPGTGTSGT